MHGQTRWQRGPSPKVEFCCARPRDPGLVIEQYALLCAMKVRPLVLCLCFIYPFTKKEALQTATFTPLLAAPLNELKHFSIHMWKYTTHSVVMVSTQPFLLSVKKREKNVSVEVLRLYERGETQAPVQELVPKCL